MQIIAVPRNSTPASDDQREAICAGYRVLGAAPVGRRSTPARCVCVDRLEACGIDRALLCWFLFQGHLNHFHADSRRRAGKPRPVASVLASPLSWFSLTGAGIAFAARLLAADRAGNIVALPMGDLTPHFDPAQRVFSWGANILKRYRRATRR